jgi:hypothetical protein
VIVSPRRSVTRFFIPLIDVLILLFCIFLLMPFVSGPPASELAPEPKAPPEKALPEDVRSLQAMLAEEKLRVQRLEKERTARITDRLSVRTLFIDDRAGELHYYDPDRQDIKSEADALRLIRKQKKIASEGGVVKDVYFLILYPRKASPYPTLAQVEQIKQWFREVPYGFDTP